MREGGIFKGGYLHTTHQEIVDVASHNIAKDSLNIDIMEQIKEDEMLHSGYIVTTFKEVQIQIPLPHF